MKPKKRYLKITLYWCYDELNQEVARINYDKHTGVMLEHTRNKYTHIWYYQNDIEQAKKHYNLLKGGMKYAKELI